MARRQLWPARCAAITLLLACAGSPAIAAEPSSTALAERLVVARGLPEALTDPLSVLTAEALDEVIARHPELGTVTAARRAAVRRDAARAAAATVQLGYVERTAPYVARSYDADDLAALVGFFDGPVGRSITAKQPAFDAAVSEVALSLKPQFMAAVKADVCHTPAPPPLSSVAPASPAAVRLANSTGVFWARPFSSPLEPSEFAGFACAPSAKVDAGAFFSASANAAARLQSAYRERVAAAYDRVFTPAELSAMTVFEGSQPGRIFGAHAIQMTPATALLGLELDRQFAQAACAELGCRTPPDAPQAAWADPPVETLRLAREAVRDELPDTLSLDPARVASAGLLAGAFKDPQERAAWIAKARYAIEAVEPEMVDAYARFYAEAYSPEELQALVGFYESDAGRGILEAKREAATKLQVPAFTPEQRAAITDFDASTTGRAIRAKQLKLLGGSAILSAVFGAELHNLIAAQGASAPRPNATP